MERKDVPQNLKWKVSDIFASDEAWEEEFKQIVFLSDKSRVLESYERYKECKSKYGARC